MVVIIGIVGFIKGDGDEEVGMVCIVIVGFNGVVLEKFFFG